MPTFREMLDLLNEASVIDDGRLTGCRVWRNPSARDLETLAAERDLRGLVDGNTVYVWPAELATHRMIPQQIGIPYHDDLLPFYVKTDGYVMPHFQARDQWCDNDPDFTVGDIEIFISHDYFVVDDYLHSTGFNRLVGNTPRPDRGDQLPVHASHY